MRDWQQYVHDHLSLPDLTREREARIRRELALQLEDFYREAIARGMTDSDADAHARAQITDWTRLADTLRGVERLHIRSPLDRWSERLDDRARERRGRGLLFADCWQDIRYASRRLLAQPGFTAVAVLTLALGIGANTAIFSVVYTTLLQPLPYDTPDQLYSVEVVIPDRRDDISSLPVRVQDYLEWSRAGTAFSAVAALTPAEWNLTGDGEPQRVGGARVSSNFFAALGVPPAYGRTFLPDEEHPGRDRVVIISDALWRSRFGANPAVLESRILLNGESHVVVGIAPPTLLVPTGPAIHTALPFAPRVDVWKPIAPTQKDLEGESWNHGLIVRLKAGESLERGRMQLQNMLNASLRALVPDMKTEFQTRMVPLREIYSGKIRLRLLLVFGAAALLLLAACTNVANLYLGRSASRGQEFAIRASLGASRSRIIWQVVIESTLLAVIGGIAGIAAAYLCVGVLLAQGPSDVRVLGDVGPRLPVLIVSLLVSIACGVLCGLLPAVQAYRKDARSVLQESERGHAGGRAAATRQLLVGVEVALSTALLASAALLLHSFVRVTQADRGYAIEHVLAFDLTPAGPRYSAGPTRAAFYQELLTEVRALPGVSAAGAVTNLPALGESNTQVVFLSSDAGTPNVTLQRPVAGYRNATPGYFAASGSTLHAGRIFSEQDTTPVAVIGESLARRLWPNDRQRRRRPPDSSRRGQRRGYHRRWRGSGCEARRARSRPAAAVVPAASSGLDRTHVRGRAHIGGSRHARGVAARSCQAPRRHGPDCRDADDEGDRLDVAGAAALPDDADRAVRRRGAAVGRGRGVWRGQLLGDTTDARHRCPPRARCDVAGRAHLGVLARHASGDRWARHRPARRGLARPDAAASAVRRRSAGSARARRRRADAARHGRDRLLSAGAPRGEDGSAAGAARRIASPFDRAFRSFAFGFALFRTSHRMRALYALQTHAARTSQLRTSSSAASHHRKIDRINSLLARGYCSLAKPFRLRA